MEKMTAKQAMQRMIDRYKQRTEANPKAKLVGLDINDYLTVFLESTDVILLEYFMQPEGIPGRDAETNAGGKECHAADYLR